MHAERLTVPRGWMLCDRRAEAPALFVADVVAVAGDQVVAEGGAPRRRRSRRAADTTRNLFDEIAADLSEAPIEVVVAPHLVVVEEVLAEVEVEVVEPEPVAPVSAEEPAEPESVESASVESASVESESVEPEPDEHEDLPSLQATSPLLARAFRQTGPQRSVLTQPSADEATAD